MAKVRSAKTPYEGYKVYGPYISKREGRRIVALVSTGHRTSMSYARFLMSEKLGRVLLCKEEVDHIDKDKLNDALDNLRILDKSDHRKMHDKDRSVGMIELTCFQCAVRFSRKTNQIKTRWGSKRSFCSRSCSGRFYAIKRRTESIGEIPYS